MEKQVINTLILIYFVKLPLGRTTKVNFVTIQTLDPKLC